MTDVETVRYASLIQARREIKELDTTVDPDTDARVLDALYFVSGRIDAIAGLTFAPYVASRYFDAYGNHIDDSRRTLDLDWPLLAVTALVVNGTTLVAGTDYLTEPRGETPITRLRLLSGAPVGWSSYSDDWQDSIAVTGLWGERSGYARALVDSDDTVLNDPSLSATATSLTVASISESDANGRAPRFSPGQLLALSSNGATEFVEVLAATIVTGPPAVHTLTIRRGARDSTPAVHLKDTAIQIYTPDPAIERAALLWAAYLYKRRGQFETVSFDGITATRWPKDAPEEILNILARYETPGDWRAVG